MIADHRRRNIADLRSANVETCALALGEEENEGLL
jgi:hypothetical protein